MAKSKVEGIFDQIQKEYCDFVDNHAKGADGNASAGTKARVSTNTLTKLMKDYRKESTASFKKKK